MSISTTSKACGLASSVCTRLLPIGGQHVRWPRSLEQSLSM
jgi:hypothetical protein